jgi:hypothetical protein
LAIPPLTLQRLEIQLSGDNIEGQATSGTIYVDNLRLKYPGTVTGVERETLAPSLFSLEQNYPNPFNPSTAISYQLSAVSSVSLKVFDVLGREVATLANGVGKPGVHSVQWNGRNERGEVVSTGIYFYQLRAENLVTTKKMMLLK